MIAPETIELPHKRALVGIVYPGQGNLPNASIDDSLNGKYADILDGISRTVGVDPSRVDFTDPNILADPEKSQPLLVGSSMIARRALLYAGIEEPDFVIASSLGEWGMFSEMGIGNSQVLEGVRQRGLACKKANELMAEMGVRGCMKAYLATKRTDLGDYTDFWDMMIDLSQKATDQLGQPNHFGMPAAYNRPGQVVVSGSSKFHNTLKVLINKRAISQRDLEAIESAYHGDYMAPAQEAMADFFASQKFPGYDNAITLALSPTSVSSVDSLGDFTTNLTEQLTKPVLLKPLAEKFRASIFANPTIEEVVMFECAPPGDNDKSTDRGTTVNNIAATIGQEIVSDSENPGRKVRFTYCRVSTPSDIKSIAVTRALTLVTANQTQTTGILVR